MEKLEERIDKVSEGICPDCGQKGTLMCIPTGTYIEEGCEENCYEFQFWCENCRYYYRSDVPGYETYILELHPDGQTTTIGGSPDENLSINMDAQELWLFLLKSEDVNGKLSLTLVDIANFLEDDPERLRESRINGRIINGDQTITGDLDIHKEIKVEKESLQLFDPNSKIQSERADI